MKIFRIAVPIPFEEEVHQFKDDPYTETYGGHLNVDDAYDLDQVEAIEKKFPNAKPIGIGSFGIAYDLGDKILKVTSDPSEFEIANRLIKYPLFTHAKVYGVDTDLGYIVLEKLRVLNNQEQKFFDVFHDYANQYNRSGAKFMIAAKFFEYLKTIRANFIEENGFDEILFDVFVDFANGLFHQGVNIRDIDVHAMNVGFNEEGDLKILDLGGSR